MNDKLKKLTTISPLKITIIIIVLSLIMMILNVPFLQFMELKALDLRMKSRGAVPSGGETVIVTVDEKSVSELGRWPWPRTTIARLVDTLKSYGAKAVGFDIVFAEPDSNSSMKAIAALTKEINQAGLKDPKLKQLLDKKRAQADTDAALTKAIKKAANVTLGFFFHLSKKEVSHLTQKEIDAQPGLITGARYQLVQSATGKYDDALFFKAYAAARNLKPLAEASQNSGYFNAFPDSDGVIRWAPMVIKFGDSYYSSLPLSLLQQYMDWPNLALNMGEGGVESIKLGDIVIPVDESGRLLVNYLGPAKTFPHYSIADILAGRLSPDLFKNKIVIVGATAIGIYDLRVTPFSEVYPGVEIHATIIDNILRQSFLQHSILMKLSDIFIVIVLGLIIGIVIPRMKAVSGMLLSIFIVAAFVFGNTFIFTHYNIWLNLIYPVLTMLLIYLVITVYRYVTEEAEKKKIRGAFQYYLTASVMNEILKDPAKLKLGGDKKNLTVMFSDIRGFTTISEGLTPEQLVHLLNEYLTAMTDIVFKYEGLLDKYIGDAVMAVWGDPVDQPDHPHRACMTALEMMAKLKSLQEKWASEGWPYIDIGIGINTGDMTVGNMGSLMRFDYTVMGDSVNLGSRLEGTNKEYGTHIIISESTYAAVKDVMFCRELGAVKVKGKKRPVVIYELLCEKKDAAPLESYVRQFEEGFAKYKQGKWDDAIAAFGKVLEVKPDDPTAKIYIEWCKALKEHPPEGEWDGVFTMTKK